MSPWSEKYSFSGLAKQFSIAFYLPLLYPRYNSGNPVCEPRPLSNGMTSSITVSNLLCLFALVVLYSLRESWTLKPFGSGGYFFVSLLSISGSLLWLDSPCVARPSASVCFSRIYHLCTLSFHTSFFRIFNHRLLVNFECIFSSIFWFYFQRFSYFLIYLFVSPLTKGSCPHWVSSPWLAPSLRLNSKGTWVRKPVFRH